MGFSHQSLGGLVTAKALHRHPLRLAQLATFHISFQDILCRLVMEWPEKTGPGILHWPVLPGFTSVQRETT